LPFHLILPKCHIHVTNIERICEIRVKILKKISLFFVFERISFKNSRKKRIFALVFEEKTFLAG